MEVAGQWCKVNFAVNTLGFSRRFHVFATPKQDAEHTYELSVALIIVTKDIYLKNGILYFADQDEGYKCFEFSGRGSVYEAVQRYSQVYIVCDNNDYFLYNLVFSGAQGVSWSEFT